MSNPGGQNPSAITSSGQLSDQGRFVLGYVRPPASDTKRCQFDSGNGFCELRSVIGTSVADNSSSVLAADATAIPEDFGQSEEVCHADKTWE